MTATVLKIILCCFAVLGFADLVIYILNIVSFKNSDSISELRIVSCPDENAEYSVRFYEGLLRRTGADLAVASVVLGKDVKLSDADYKRLSDEYGNLKKEET